MHRNTYYGRDAAERPVRGYVEAEKEGAAAAGLHTRDYAVAALKRACALAEPLAFWRRISARELALFCRQFGVLLEAGVPAAQALDLLARQGENVLLREAAGGVLRYLREGSSLADAFRRFPGLFPELLTSMVEAGEVGGTLDEVFARLALHFEKEHRLRERIRTALAYPAVVLAVAAVAFTVMLTLVLPTMTAMLAEMGVALPLPTRLAVALGRFLESRWPLIPGGLLLVFLAAAWVYRLPRGRELADRVVLRLPLAGPLARKAAVARVARVTSTLIRGGIPVLRALEVAERVAGNIVVARAVAATAAGIREGRGMAEAMERSGVFPLMATRMIGVGEAAGRLDTFLEKVAVFYEEDVDNTLGRLASVVEPLLVVVVGGVTGGIVFALLLPLFSVYGALQ